MLSENTISKLYEMRLNSMAQSFRDQMTDSAYVSMQFEERFGCWLTQNGTSEGPTD